MAEAGSLAALLLAARRGGSRVASVPGALVPQNAAAAFAVQDAVMSGLGMSVAGWKVGAPDATSEPSCAPLFAPLVSTSPAVFPVAADDMRAVEAELALRLGRDLPARPDRPYGEDEVWEAVASLHVAIELLQSRYADRKGLPLLAALADNLSNGGFCYGTAIANRARVDYLTQPARLLIDGQEVKSATGGNPAGHPKRLLAWLANHAASRGRPLRAGDIITTGSHTGITIAPPGAMVEAQFAGLGEARATLSPA